MSLFKHFLFWGGESTNCCNKLHELNEIKGLITSSLKGSNLSPQLKILVLEPQILLEILLEKHFEVSNNAQLLTMLIRLGEFKVEWIKNLACYSENELSSLKGMLNLFLYQYMLHLYHSSLWCYLKWSPNSIFRVCALAVKDRRRNSELWVWECVTLSLWINVIREKKKNLTQILFPCFVSFLSHLVLWGPHRHTCYNICYSLLKSHFISDNIHWDFRHFDTFIVFT